MNKRIKELEIKLESSSDDRERVDTLQVLVYELFEFDYERSIKLAKQAYELAKSISYEKGLAISALINGFRHLFTSDYEAALKISYELYELSQKIGDQFIEARALHLRGTIYRTLGDLDQALKSLLDSHNILVKLENKTSPQYKRSFALCLNVLAGVYYDLNNFDYALKYYKEMLLLYDQLGDEDRKTYPLNGIGNIYCSLKKYDRALKYYSKSLEIDQKGDSEINVSRTLSNIGTCYEGFGDYDKALYYHLQSLEIREKLTFKYPNAIITNLLDIGGVFVRQNNLDEAEKFLQRGLNEAEAIKVKPKLLKAYKLLGELYEKKRMYKKSLEYHKKFHIIEEEIYSEEFKGKLKNQQIAHQVETARKEAEIYRLKNVELAKALQQLKDMQSQLVMKEKMASLGNLVAGIAHEVNNPIGAVNGSADVSIRAIAKIKQVLDKSQTLNELKSSKKFQRSIKIIEENNQITSIASKRIVKIVRSLKNFSRLDEAEFQMADIHEGINSTLTLIHHEIKNKIEVIKNYDNIPKIKCYPNQLNQVFMNLLINAAHAIKNKGTITISTFATDHNVQIKIVDTGKGIPSEELGKIFDPGFTTKSRGVGTGLGLSISYNIIQKHNGKIEVKSVLDKGTEFIITLPVNQS